MTKLTMRDVKMFNRRLTAKKKPREKREHPEDDEAIKLWAWAQTQPKLRDDLYHIPNGGKRGVREAARLKKIGVRAGVWDYHLPVARGNYFGAWIELKAAAPHRSRTSVGQVDWGHRMLKQGHYARVCYGFEEAKQALEFYIGLPKKYVDILPRIV